MEEKEKCPKCGEQENLHFNYDYSNEKIKIEEILCNECGEFWIPNAPMT